MDSTNTINNFRKTVIGPHTSLLVYVTIKCSCLSELWKPFSTVVVHVNVFGKHVTWQFYCHSTFSILSSIVYKPCLKNTCCFIDSNILLIFSCTLIQNRTEWTSMATYEPHHEKTGFLHMRKQRCRSAVQ